MSREKSKQQRIKNIAKAMGGEIGEPIDGVLSGPIGVARLAAIMSARLQPSRGKRTGRPSNPEWVRREKVPMKEATLTQLQELAKSFSSEGRKVSPMQVAAQLLERGLEQIKDEDEEVSV